MSVFVVFVCELCVGDGGEVLWWYYVFCVVLVDEVDYLGFCWVICYVYVKEMIDFVLEQCILLVNVVWVVEVVQCEVMQFEKVNLVMLGNMILYVYWYVILCFIDDCYFFSLVWVELCCVVDEVLLVVCCVLLLQLCEVVCWYFDVVGLMV